MTDPSFDEMRGWAEFAQWWEGNANRADRASSYMRQELYLAMHDAYVAGWVGAMAEAKRWQEV